MQTPISTGSGMPGTGQRPGQQGSSTLQSGPSNSSPIVQSLAQIPSALHSWLQHSDASAHVLPFAVQGGAQEIAVPQVMLPAGTYWIAFMVDSQSLPIPNDTQAKMIPSVWIGQPFNDPPPQQYPIPAGKGTQFPVNLWIVVLQ